MANKVRWALTTTLLLSAASFGTSSPLDLSKVHEHMTDEELLSVFHVKDRSAVPNYEIVPVYHEQREVHRTRRSIPSDGKKRMYVTLKSLELYLEPVDHVLFGLDTPIFTAWGSNSSQFNISYEKVSKPWPLNYKMLLQDHVNNAALVMSKDSDGKRYFEGTIGNDLAIKPVPSRVRGVAKCEVTSDQSVHFIYNTNVPYVPSRTPQAPYIENEVDIVYPEILVIVDHETYLGHDKSLQTLSQYMAVFWNAVDLRFRAMRRTKVRLNIAGLIVPIDEKGAPYLTEFRAGKDFLRASETFNAIGKYLYKEERLKKSMYDLVVVMTSYNLCSTTLDNGCDASTLGLARIGGACQHELNGADVAVAVIEDHMVFDGVFTAAHEIAHLLGVDHDGEHSRFVPGGAGCNDRKGNIMSSVQKYSSDAFLWSDCSLTQMRRFLGTNGTCLRNKPVVRRPIGKKLPAMVLSRDEQCKMMYDTIACDKYNEDECGKLYCREPGGKCFMARSPLEGAPCSGEGMCLDGKCLHMDEDNNDVDERSRLFASDRSTELISADAVELGSNKLQGVIEKYSLYSHRPNLNYRNI